MMRLACLLLVACGPAVQPATSTVPSPHPVTAIDPALEPLRGLLGTWEGSDPDHHTTGGFTLEPELAGKVLVRRSHNDSAQAKHQDLTIMFAGPAGLRASYFDNEGHAFQYSIAVTPGHIEMVSDEVPNQPRFKLRYDPHGGDELAIDFAIAMPGTAEFKHYVGGVLHRVR